MIIYETLLTVSTLPDMDLEGVPASMKIGDTARDLHILPPSF